jgi:hypothetical protein
MDIQAFKPGDKVKFDIESITNDNHCRVGGRSWASDEYLAKSKKYADQVGTIERRFEPGYEYNVEFPDGQIFHAKHNFLKPIEDNTMNKLDELKKYIKSLISEVTDEVEPASKLTQHEEEWEHMDKVLFPNKNDGRKANVIEEDKAKLGTGTRFKNLVKQLAKKELEEYSVHNPAALAAWIGRKKYGKEKFQKMSAAGKKEESIDPKREELKEHLKVLIREVMENNHLINSLAKYGSEVEKILKSVIGKWVSTSCHQTAVGGPALAVGKLVVDDGEAGLAFTMDIIPEKRNVFTVNYTVNGHRDMKTLEHVSMDELGKWLKGDFKKMIKDLDKEKKEEKIEDESKEIKDKDVKKQIDHADDIDKEAKKLAKVEKEVAPQEGGEVVEKIEKQIDADENANKKNIAPDKKELKVKGGKEEMKKVGEIDRQEDIKVKNPPKPPKTKDVDDSHMA